MRDIADSLHELLISMASYLIYQKSQDYGRSEAEDYIIDIQQQRIPYKPPYIWPCKEVNKILQAHPSASKESKSWLWTGFTALFQLIVAYVITLIVYQIGSKNMVATIIILSIVGACAIAAAVYCIVKKVKNKGGCADCPMKGNCGQSDPATCTKPENGGEN